MQQFISGKPWFLALLAMLVSINTVKAERHQQHSLMGSHGMFVFADGNNNLYASHLPLYSSPHDYQIIYRLKVRNKVKLKLLLEQGLVTLLPEQFDLQHMLNRESFSVQGMFYQGHFERQGKAVFSDAIEFESAVFIRQLDSEFVTGAAHIYALPVSQEFTLLLHKIQQRPSFDAIGFSNRQKISKRGLISCDKPARFSEETVRQVLLDCGFSSVIYLEVQDFK